MTEERFYELLKEKGDAIAADIEGDRRLDVERGLLEPLDVGFECYVRELDGEQVGYIYMGDCGEWAFRVAPDGETLDDDYTILSRVKKLTPYSDEAKWESWEEVGR